ncbi:MAG: hypothetical protein IPN63_04665 [Gammaproteobacteria bacterium]|nr:hypothetical protein [Gammaproteobacteria bacterium]
MFMTVSQSSPASRASLAILFALVVAGCATTKSAAPNTDIVVPIAGKAADRVKVDKPAPPAPEAEPNTEPLIMRGDDAMFRAPRPTGAKAVVGDPVSLDFEQAPVTEVVHAILGDILAMPYIINQPVAGSLTVHTAQPLPRDQILPVLESILQANGLALVIDASGVYHVGRPETLRGIAPSLGNLGGALPPGQNLMIVPLQFVGAAEMAEILAPIAAPENIVRVDPVRNLLILAATRSQLEGFMQIVQTFDVDVLKGMSIGLFPLKNVSVAEVESALAALSGGAAAKLEPPAKGGGCRQGQRSGRHRGQCPGAGSGRAGIAGSARGAGQGSGHRAPQCVVDHHLPRLLPRPRARMDRPVRPAARRWQRAATVCLRGAERHLPASIRIAQCALWRRWRAGRQRRRLGRRPGPGPIQSERWPWRFGNWQQPRRQQPGRTLRFRRLQQWRFRRRLRQLEQRRLRQYRWWFWRQSEWPWQWFR